MVSLHPHPDNCLPYVSEEWLTQRILRLRISGNDLASVDDPLRLSSLSVVHVHPGQNNRTIGPKMRWRRIERHICCTLIRGTGNLVALWMMSLTHREISKSPSRKVLVSGAGRS